MSLPIAFILCLESGSLEQETLLMVKSLRRFGGKLKDTPIFSYQLREGKEISAETEKALHNMNVHHEKKILNTKYYNYPLANKPLLCSYVEENLDADIIVFLDSDLVFFSEPTEFLLPEGYDIGLRPEHRKMIGSSGKGDPNNAFWNELYQIAGVTEERMVTTTVDQKEIRAFFNSGVVSVRRGKGIFHAWKVNFERLVSSKDISKFTKENFYFEQSMFSATVIAETKKIWQFSSGYNYPIHYHNSLVNDERRLTPDEIICIHDHFFREREWYRERIWARTLKGLKKFDKGNSKYSWLCRYLEENSVSSNPVQIGLEKILFSSLAQKVLPARY